MRFSIIPNQQTPAVPELVEPIEEYIANKRELIQDFLQYARTMNRAVGLAANQVQIEGQRINERFFVHRRLRTDQWEVVVNPKILEKGGICQTRIEYCLTWEGRKMLATRWGRCKVGYYSIDGQYIEKEVAGFEAQVWQHEIDHLNGVEEHVVPLNHSTQLLKVGRNDSCPCGSGRKYKQCCLSINEDGPVAYN